MQSAVIAKIKFQTLIDVEHSDSTLRMEHGLSVVPGLMPPSAPASFRFRCPPPEYESDSVQ